MKIIFKNILLAAALTLLACQPNASQSETTDTLADNISPKTLTAFEQELVQHIKFIEDTVKMPPACMTSGWVTESELDNCARKSDAKHRDKNEYDRFYAFYDSNHETYKNMIVGHYMPGYFQHFESLRKQLESFSPIPDNPRTFLVTQNDMPYAIHGGCGFMTIKFDMTRKTLLPAEILVRYENDDLRYVDHILDDGSTIHPTCNDNGG